MPAPTYDADFLSLQQAFAGQYSLQRELGRGGMGVVYLAREVSLDRLVAIKVLPAALAEARPGLRERFLREARTAAKLSHPNIVPIFRVGDVGGFVYFAMAYVDGETVGQRLRARGPFPPAEASRILREAAWALAYAHAQGVVHRDVKPDNILLERGSGRALLTDFGIAHVAEATALTDEAMVMGTAHFMSPEQAGGEPIDGRSDLYGLGVVGYLMLTGRLPFDAPTMPAVLAKHLTEAPPPVVAPAGGMAIPASLARTIERCLAKAPAARFATGEALAEALTQASQQQRQLPAALRVWLQKRDPMRPLYFAWSGFTGMLTVGLIASHFQEPTKVTFGAVPWWGFGLIMSVVVALPLLPMALFRLSLTRRTLAAGYTLDDLRLALRDDVARRREEMAVEVPERDGLGVRLYQLLTYGSVVWTVAIALWGGSWFPREIAEEVIKPLSVVGTIVFVVLGSALGLTFPGRGIRSGKLLGWRLRFWESPVGRWTGKLAGAFLKRRAAPDQLVERPTEVAISMAAEQLFQALPRATRAQLGDLPAVVHQLEGHAVAMRSRLGELDALLATARTPGQAPASVRTGAASALDAHRDAVADELREARAAAAGRLEQTVAALETIRLDLLRLQGGVGDVGRLTTALEVARDLNDDVRRLVAGHDGAAAALGDPRREMPSPPEAAPATR